MDSTGSRQGFVLLGRVSRPHGIRGELKVQPYTAAPEGLCHYRQLYLSADDGATKIARCSLAARVSGTMVLLRLEGCTDRSQAQQLVGMQVWVDSGCLPPPAEGEFYLHTLEGMRARTTDGRNLGVVAGLLGGSGQEILVLRNGQEEYLIPAIGRFIAAIETDQVVFDLPPGLLEING